MLIWANFLTHASRLPLLSYNNLNFANYLHKRFSQRQRTYFSSIQGKNDYLAFCNAIRVSNSCPDDVTVTTSQRARVVEEAFCISSMVYSGLLMVQEGNTSLLVVQIWIIVGFFTMTDFDFLPGEVFK